MSIWRYLCGLSIVLFLLVQQSKPGSAFTEDAFQAFDSVVEDVTTAYIPYESSMGSASQWFGHFQAVTMQGFDSIDHRADTVRQCLTTS
jgi:hypothetical protein